MDYSKNNAAISKHTIAIPSGYMRNIVVLTGLYILAAFGARNQLLGLGLAILEWAVLFSLALQKQYFKSYCMLIAFIMTSFETTTFTSEVVSDDATVYSIYSLPLVRSILCYAFIIFLCIAFRARYHADFKAKIRSFPEVRKVLNFFPVMLISGIITGLLVFIVNDNGVATSGWYFTKYVEFTIKIITLMSLIYSAALICIGDPEKRRQLEKFCEQLIICAALATTITLIIGLRGYYGSKGTLIFMPLATSIAAALILFCGFKRANRLVYFLIGAIFSFEIMFVAGSHMGSKFYLVPAASFIILVLKGMRNGKLGSFAGFIFILFIVIAGSGLTITSTYIGTYNNWKLNQLLQLFEFRGNTLASWYFQLPNSPRIRVDEFMSTLYEYIQKPWYLLFGKGTAGTITHLWGNTIWTIKGSGAFSDYEIDSGIFMFMHESLNVLFIRHGLLGLSFFVSVIIMLVKKMLKSPWALIALIWFVFYWGTYRSWWIGAIALILALTPGAIDTGDDEKEYR